MDRTYREIECSGALASVEVVGSGPAVIVVGAAVPMAWTRPAAESIALRGFRVVNFDYGPPKAWTGDPIPRTSLAQVADVSAVLGALDIAHAHVIGLSRGAITAYGLAARFPNAVDKLVLGFPVAGFYDTILLEAVNESDKEGDLDPLAALDKALDSVFAADFLAVHRQAGRDLFMSPPGTVVRVERTQETMLGDDESVDAPTLIVSGGRDNVVSPEHPERLRRAIPQARLHEFDQASHGFVMEQPDAFADVVVPFLND